MPVSIEELIRRLTESGLMSADEISLFTDSLPPERRPTNAKDFAHELVRGNNLTKMQAKLVYSGKLDNLVFGNYIIMEKIGEGGMGQVFKATDRKTNRNVALKVLSAKAVKNARLVKRFQRETRVASQLEHINIVKAYDCGKFNNIRFLVMEYVDGIDLMSYLKVKRKLPISQAISLVIQTATGLAYAHAKGIFHRDIKPSNLLLNKSKTVKILDMGLARIDEDEADDDDQRLTMPGQMLGTARFMSPEQVEDSRFADHRSDIYSLGCTLYFLLTRRTPYRGETEAHILIAHVTQPIPQIHDKRSDVSEMIQIVFEKMVAKDPQNRFQSMEEVIAELQKCVGQDPDSSILTQSTPLVSVPSGADEPADDIDDNEVRKTESCAEDSDITEFPTADTEFPTESATSPDAVETATCPGRPDLTLHGRWPRIPLRRKNKLIAGVSAIVIVAAATVWLVFFAT